MIIAASDGFGMYWKSGVKKLSASTMIRLVNRPEIKKKICINRNKPFHVPCFHHIETSQITYSANQLTGSYIMGKLNVKGITLKITFILRQH